MTKKLQALFSLVLLLVILLLILVAMDYLGCVDLVSGLDYSFDFVNGCYLELEPNYFNPKG